MRLRYFCGIFRAMETKASKTSIKLTDRAKKALDEITEKTGLTQTQVLEALLCQAETIVLAVRWHDVELPEPPKVKKLKKS